MIKFRHYFIASFLFICAPAFSANLNEVYRDAVQNDPTYAAARAQYLATKQALPISIAAILPDIAATGHSTFNRLETDSPFLLESTQRFNTHGYTFSLTQPLVNFRKWIGVSAASAEVKEAHATFAAAKQDLMIRVADAYFAVLEAQDDLRFTRAEKRTNARQLDQARQRFNVGLDAITAVHEAKASFDAVVAREIAAKNALSNSFERLTEITGVYYDGVAPLKGNVPLVRPNPENIDEWTKFTDEYNLRLQAARFGAISAKRNVKVNFADHLPVLDIVGSHNKEIGGPRGAASSEVTTQKLSLQASLPIFRGGLTLAQTRQARYNYKNSVALLEATHREVLRETNERFDNTIAGISKLRADRQRIVSSRSAFKSSEEAFKVGSRTIVDVLISQRNLFQAQRDHAADQYTFINDILKLKEASGILDEGDLAEINGWLKPA